MIKKLLLVDDSAVARKILLKCIPNAEQYEVHEANNGLEGFEKYKELQPDLTFMDLTMPVMGGVEAIEEIRKHDPKAIVIVTTADVQTKTIEKVMDLGALLVVRKPPSSETVNDAINQAEIAFKNRG